VEPFGTSGAYFGAPGLTVLTYNQAPVPTLISRFDAQAAAFGVDLSWEIHDASELERFRIVRRSDGTARPVETDIAANRRSFHDDNVTSGARYEYQLITIDHAGDEVASAPVVVTIPTAAVALLPNVPNPFNPTTTLRFVVPTQGQVTLAIYDVAGRHVTTLVDGVRNAGMNAIEWNGTDTRGNPVASGVYVSRLKVGTAPGISRTMVLLK
jgi:hypothetical protein